MTGPAPLEIVVVTVPGTETTPEVLHVLDVVEGQAGVTVVDMALVCRDADGTVRRLELPDPPLEARHADTGPGRSAGGGPAHGVRGERSVRDERFAASPLIGEEDVAEIAELVEPGALAVAAVVEHTWSSRIAEAAEAARGQVVAVARIGLVPEDPSVLDELIGLAPIG
jgi:hypothetical protein